ncbi:lipopolysaccharide biosynthesis protein [Ancylobacter sp. IITR112]|uniref:lipopolysaccharide biosynthesis protein n=1 Tax=Ancylobacter sp. IITR112 TaxID=3138073 RepID=UPI00352B0A32
MRLRFDDLRLRAYLLSKKMRQFPSVIRENVPRFYVDEECCPAVGNNYAIVVSYSGFGVASDLIDLLKALRRRGVNAVVICNGLPKLNVLEMLRRDAHRVMVRRNVGRDFGAFRAATLRLAAEGRAVSRMLYFNDSVIYIAGAELDAMVHRMIEDTYPVIGAFENHEFEHHIGSYVFSVSGEVFYDSKLLSFWKRYRPYDIRPHAIHQGEIALSRQLKKRGYAIGVIYSVDRLGEHLRTFDAAQLLGLLKYMTPAWRSAFLAQTREGTLGVGRQLVSAFEVERHTSRPSGDTPQSSSQGAVPTLSSLTRPPDTPRGRQQTTFAAAHREVLRWSIIQAMLAEVSAHSQIHVGFGLFRLLLGAPVVKKDLLQRGLWSEQDCLQILDDVPPEARRRIIRQLINRGRPLHVSGTRRFLLRHGLE